MTIEQTLRQLLEKTIISPEKFHILQKEQENRSISIHWEVRLLLLAGISMLTGGLGVLIYQNIDTIGHQAIIALIALAILACAGLVYKKRQVFDLHVAQKEQPLADNVLLLACSLFLILEGYLQYQYQIFGSQYGIATLIPSLIFFFCAYRFDHKGVLTMALTGLAAWAGISVTPLSIFQDNVFKNEVILIRTGIALGLFFIALGLLLNFKRIKPHFTFSYLNFGFNLVCVAALYGAFSISHIYCLLCLVMSGLGILYARREQSYFFLLAGVIYGYIAFTTLISNAHLDFFGWLMYGVLSCAGIVIFFLNYKKLLQ
jgi:Predicted membrane protein (DUF2157)